MRLEDSEVYEFAKERGELLLRPTPSGTRQLKAKFVEVSRNVLVLTLQRWTADNPWGTCSFPLVGDQISKLIEFIRDVQRVKLTTKGKVTVEVGALEHPQFTDDSLLHAMRGKNDLLREILRTEATLGDVKAWGFRKRSLDEFRLLLRDDEHFEKQQEKTPNNSAERVWQDFFEANSWIFGYGLSYIFLGAVDPDHLERAVAGYSVAWKGSRPDAMMKTRGAISALCLVEIKTHKTPLVRTKPKRSGAHSASAELIDALSQSQASVLHAERELRENFRPVDQMGDPISERIYNYRPRALLVVGKLDEFNTELGPNEEKYSSFEMFRRNLTTPEIVTFDELYERARYIVEHTDESTPAAPPGTADEPE